LAHELDTPTTSMRLLVVRPGHFLPAHAGQRQNQHGVVVRCLDSTLGPLFTNTSKEVLAGTLGSFLVEGAKGSFPGVSLASPNPAPLQQMHTLNSERRHPLPRTYLPRAHRRYHSLALALVENSGIDERLMRRNSRFPRSPRFLSKMPVNSSWVKVVPG